MTTLTVPSAVQLYNDNTYSSICCSALQWYA